MKIVKRTLFALVFTVIAFAEAGRPLPGLNESLPPLQHAIKSLNSAILAAHPAQADKLKRAQQLMQQAEGLITEVSNAQ